MTQWVLAIDQGTHASRAIAFTPEGMIAAEATQEVNLFRHSNFIIEQDPLEILAATQKVIDMVCARATGEGAQNISIVSAGLATQRSSVVAWDRESSLPLSPVISWQDRRNEEDLQSAKNIEKLIRQKTGLPISPHYGANKLRSLFQSNPDVQRAHKEGRLAFGPLASWLLYHLIEGSPFVVDHANASRTLLWNLSTHDWDNDLLAHFEIPREALPKCLPIVSDYGKLKGYNIPCKAVSGDQNAALFARGEPRPDELFANIGTGAFVLRPTKKLIFTANLLSGINLSGGPDQQEPARYHIEGTVNGAAAALDWYFSGMVPESRPSTEEISQWLEETGDLPLFINSIGGIGSPWWKPGQTPGWVDPDSNPVKPDLRHAICSIIESIVFMLGVNLKEIEAELPKASAEYTISISGGLAKFDGLCQKLASLTGADIHRFEQSEATARGIAWLASGMRYNWRENADTIFSPQTDPLLAERFQNFRNIMDKL